MNRRFCFKGFNGKVIIALLAVSAAVCLVFPCLPVLSQTAERIERNQESMANETPMKMEFKEALPEEIEFTGIVYNIEVSVEEGKYECLVLLNIARLGTGMDINQLLYITHPSLQRIFELAYMKDKGLRVWARETTSTAEMEGAAYQVFKVTRVRL